MSRKKFKEQPSPENQVNEPATITYQAGKNKHITFFNSFEEMNDHDHWEMAQHTPLERLQNITLFISQIYAEELKNKMKDLTVYFK